MRLAATVALAGVATARFMGPGDNDGRNVAAFYYMWYGNPAHDGEFFHWNHGILPHWTPQIDAQYPKVAFVPPHDIHAPFYPQRGLYSSKDPKILREHMRDMREHGIGVAVLSWTGRIGVSEGDSQGVMTDDVMRLALDAAAESDMKVALHLEPYAGRTIETVRADLEYLAQQYGSHPSIWKVYPQRYVRTQKPTAADAVPVYFLYDSYHLPAQDWEKLLGPIGNMSVRGTAADGVFIGLWLDAHHGDELSLGGFDGAYSYFAVDGFSYGSSTRNWPSMVTFCKERSMVFVPSVGPGYSDERIRPWNAHNKRDREGGRYYERMWKAAIDSGADMASVTSYNEFGEGTQIEAVVPRSVDVDTLAPQGLALNRTIRQALGLSDAYLDYGESGPDFYMTETARFAKMLEAKAAGAGASRNDDAAGREEL